MFNRDFEMYYSNCYVRHRTRGYVKVVGTAEDGEFAILQDLSGNRFTEDDDDYLNLSIEPVGYVQSGKTVVYISLRQQRSYKKAFNLDNISYFYPQQAEYIESNLSLRDPTPEVIFNNKVTPLEEVEKALEDNYAVVIHRNFAIVKKGAYKDPVVYHRKEVVAKYVDGEFVPLDGQNDLYIRKLKVELGLCATV